MHQDKRSRSARTGFVGIGAAFIAIGLSGQPAFLVIGAVFMVLGLAALARSCPAG